MIVKTSPRFLLTLSLFSFIIFSNLVKGQQTAKLFDGTGWNVKGYLEHLPNDYNSNPSKKYPVLIFLHGVGEEGNGTSDINRVAAWGPPQLIANGTWPSSFSAGDQNFKFIVISPQCSESWQFNDVQYVVDQAISIYGSRVDLTRIYLTGLSAGGGGVWNYLSKDTHYDQKIAASVICTGAAWEQFGAQGAQQVQNMVLANSPIWAFHNQFDPTVDLTSTDLKWVTDLNAAGINPAAKLTVYPNVYAHNCWSATYDPSPNNPNQVYTWLLGYTRPNPPGNIAPVANAGSWQSVTLPARATLDASTSYPIDGYLVGYSWSKVSGPSGDIIINPTYTASQVSFTQSGNYVYQVMVKDSHGLTNSANVSITVTGGIIASPVPPLANAGSNQTITLPSNGILNGTGSSAPAGNITSYGWTKISGPTGDQVQNNSASNTTVSFSQSGFYIYQLTVTDNNYATNSNTVTITVNSALVPPLANAGNNQTITLPSLASLDGSGSTATSGSIIKYAWSKVSGSNGDSIFNPNLVKSSIRFKINGNYVYQLIVTDNHGNSNSALTTIIVNKAILPPPVANAGFSQTITLPSIAMVDGSLSSSTGTITTYSWSKIFGPSGDQIFSPTSSKSNISFSTPGIYSYQLTVVDNTFQTSIASITIKVIAAIIPPIANAGNNQTINLPTSVILDGSASTASSGSIVSYGWAKVNGPTGDTIVSKSNVKTEIRFTQIGTYNYGLTVVDNLGNSSTSIVSVIVLSKIIILPVANAGSNQTITLPSLGTLDGTASTSSTVISFIWVKLSGPGGDKILSPNSASTQVSFATSGNYVYKMSITDQNNLSSSATISILVNLATPTYLPPIANAGPNSSISLPNFGNVDASLSAAGSGSIQSYFWKKISGPAGDTILNPNQAKSSVHFSLSGYYIYSVLVTDTYLDTNSANIQIIVNPKSIIPPKIVIVGNQTLVLPALENLDGSGSSSPNGNIASYVWSKISGPVGDTISTPNLSKTKVSFSQNGNYVFQLTATDINGNSASSAFAVTVNPTSIIPPFVKVSGYSWLTLPDSLANVDASASKASTGENIQSYLWTKVSGPTGDIIINPNLVKSQIYFSQAGTFIYQVVVTDNMGLTGSALVYIYVNKAISVLTPPVAQIIGNQNITLPSLDVLDGSGSYATSGQLASFLWSQISGPITDSLGNVNQSSLRVKFSQPGFYGFKLWVTDNNGNSASSLISITVNDQNFLPPVAITGSNENIILPAFGTLDGSNSSAPSGNLTSFIWFKLSGPIGDTILNPQIAKTSVKFHTPGEYLYQLTIQDSHLQTATSKMYITVTDTSKSISISPISTPNPTGLNAQLLINLGTIPNVKSSLDSIKLIAILKDSANYPTINSFWSEISGPNQVSFISNGLVAIITNFQPGEYQFKIQVKDFKGDTASKILNVFVQPFSYSVPAPLSVKFYPNPVINSATLQLTNNLTGIVSYTIYDINGRKLLASSTFKNLDQLTAFLDLSFLGKGIYILELNFSGTKNSTRFEKN